MSVTTSERSLPQGSKPASQPIWQINLETARGHSSRLADLIRSDALDLGIRGDFRVEAARGFLVSGLESRDEAESLAKRLFAEPVVQVASVIEVGEEKPVPDGRLVHVMLRAGVTDPEAESALGAIHDLGIRATGVRTFRRYWFRDISDADFDTLRQRGLLNESIERMVEGPLKADDWGVGESWIFEKTIVPVTGASDEELMRISREGTLSLTLVEMQTIQQHYRMLGRDPVDVELETIAQTWSEHCSHKTLAGRVSYADERGAREFGNMLKETIFAATVQIREELGNDDWCVSVFRDNAGIVKFDDEFNVTFKVETHNRPSAIEPYGGANTGLGGVIRDTLGTGMGAKPVCSTDVFCFAPPDMAWNDLPPGVMHPRRIMKGVVSGVRDYGNRMGIPTVNGAVWFDSRYVGNPMVFCGNVGLVPVRMSFKEPRSGDLIVVMGGRTGRDGIHGATFSSVELNEKSEKTSSGAVQIGNAITEKMVADVLLQARDRGLYNAVTDCGAGGLSSAVGEMGADLGAEVWLDRAPLKYAGLSYTEIWISEAQERMVLAVPEDKWREFADLCQTESVEATVIGQFDSSGELVLKYRHEVVGRMSMEFLHEGRPPVKRVASYRPPESVPVSVDDLNSLDIRQTLLAILAHPNVASKHWIIRQYDHEVQGGSVVKPLVGVYEDGPSDSAVVRPVLTSDRGIAISCGMNPLYGDLDAGHMAAASIDEAIRNAVATGADPDRIGILDNFCWGYTDRPETLGSLVRAALACQESAVAMKTPFISGKDSLNNEFSYTSSGDERKTISIPSTLLISAIGLVHDTRQCVTMDLKKAGNALYLVGATGWHLGGSHALLINGMHGQGEVPVVDHASARQRYRALHQAIRSGRVQSCHDLSEGGLGVAIAEMALAGGLGVEIDIDRIRFSGGGTASPFVRMFSESCSRLVCEVAPEDEAAFVAMMNKTECTRIGTVNGGDSVTVLQSSDPVGRWTVEELRSAWKSPLDWK